MKPFYLSLLLVMLFVNGCSRETAPLPEVPEFTLTPEQVTALYGMQTPIEQIVDSGVLTFTQDGDDIDYRLLSPAQSGTYPLLVFSPGNWSTQLKYEPIVQHWVRQGYVILSRPR